MMATLAVMTSCASAKTNKYNRFKELTQDMRIATPVEARLAQTLYIEIMHN